MRDSFNGITVFASVAEAGSFAAAASRLSLTASAIGKSVARLEERLAVKLFHRTTRTLVLTDEGAAFYQTCKRLMADLDEAQAILARRRAVPAGRVRVDMPVYFGRLRVMPLLRELLEKHPLLGFQATFTDRMIDLREEGVDIVVRINASSEESPALACRFLGSERLIFCASAAYVRRHPTLATPTDLAAHECVAYGRPNGTVPPWIIQHSGDAAGEFVPRARLVAGSVEAVVDAVVAGEGVGQLATWVVRDELESGRLVQLLPDWTATGLSLYALWQRNRELLPKVHVVTHLLQKRLRMD